MYKNQRQLSQKHVIILHNCAAHACNQISDSLSPNIPCYSHLKRVSGGQKKSKNHQPGAAARCTQVQLTMWPMSMGPAQTRPGLVGGPDQTSGLISFHWDAHVSANLTQWVGKRHKHSTHTNTHTQRDTYTRCISSTWVDIGRKRIRIRMWMRIRILRAAVSGSRHTRCKASLIAHTGARQHQHVSACLCMCVHVCASACMHWFKCKTHHVVNGL